MQRVLCAALTDWFAGTTAPGKGVNDLLVHVPRDPIDVQPPASVGLIANPFRNDHAARFEAPPVARAIYVHPDGPVTMEGEIGATDRKAHSVAAACRVIVTNPNEAASMRWATYVQRAMAQSLAAFLADDADGARARSREGFRIVTANAIRVGPWKERVGEAEAIAVLAADFQIRDHVPR